jgi:hypothetical protein
MDDGAFRDLVRGTLAVDLADVPYLSIDFSVLDPWHASRRGTDGRHHRPR